MNEDDFLIQFRETPRSEFADQLYRRINKPMATTKSSVPSVKRRLALASGFLSLLFVTLLLLSPAARTFASTLVRQIGAITVAPADIAPPSEDVPTAVPPSAAGVTLVGSRQEAATLAGFTILQPVWLPAGYESTGDWSVAPQGQGTIVARTYQTTQGDHFLILNQFKYGANDRFDQSYGANETVIETEVRGRPALAISGRLMTHPKNGDSGLLPTNWLLWEEDAVNVTLFSDNLRIDALVQIAESME
jgi:hypothetical protein